MISLEESRNTIDLSDKYVIYQQNNKKQVNYYKKNFNGKLVKKAFTYNSKDNKSFLTINEFSLVKIAIMMPFSCSIETAMPS